MTYPNCPRCGCTWHGLNCNRTKTIYADGRAHNTTCDCRSPFDDEFWQDGPQ